MTEVSSQNVKTEMNVQDRFADQSSFIRQHFSNFPEVLTLQIFVWLSAVTLQKLAILRMMVWLSCDTSNNCMVGESLSKDFPEVVYQGSRR